MAENLKILNYRTSGDTAPSASNLEYGQIAVGYKKGNESIFIKNTDDEVIAIKPSGFTELTYADLKELRDDEALTPGMWYRITDFVTTVANDDEARSANHPFDVIVLATDKNILQEEAFAAMPSNGDEYFKDCKLEAWKIWYCLDNDNTRFQWADTINGKGVIYRMIDEWQNDCPYDFKNVQYKRYKVSVTVHHPEVLTDLNETYVGCMADMADLSIDDVEDYIFAYTFSLGERDGSTPVDGSMSGFLTSSVGDGYGNKGYFGNNQILPTTMRMNKDGDLYSVFCLNNIIFFTNNTKNHAEMMGCRINNGCFNMTLNGYNIEIGYDSSSIIMGEGCSEIRAANDFVMNSFGNDVRSISFGGSCHGNIFGRNCEYIALADVCEGNAFYINAQKNSLAYNCGYNTFGENCSCNVFGNNCTFNIFGYGCSNNSFGDGCNNVEMGNDCSYNTLNSNCYGNTFGNGCKYNYFQNDSNDNVFHNNVSWTALGVGCGRNEFNDGCSGNVVLGGSDNVFGAGCLQNTLGIGSCDNILGPSCGFNTFGSNACYCDLSVGYCEFNTIGNDVQYIKLAKIYTNMLNIMNGTKGESEDETIVIDVPQYVKYCRNVGFDSSNVLRVWVDADQADGVIYCGTF